MGFVFSKIFKKLFGSKNTFNIHIVGLQNAGKTTILYQYNLGKVIETTPTLGSNMEEVTHKNVKLKVWDLGEDSKGQKSIREVWDSYFTESDAVIYVIDSTDKSKEDESKQEFNKLLQNQLLKEAVFLVFANKQDLPDVMTAEEIAAKYKLSDIKSHSWHIQVNLTKLKDMSKTSDCVSQACSATQNQGLEQGLDWVVEKILEKNK